MDLDSLSGLEFEQLIYDVLIKLGFRANLMKSTGDGGIDIEAYYDGMLFKGKYLIQCKRWNSKVGEPVLRDLFGTTVSNNALKGILITTNYFTQQAKDFCVGKNIELINRDQLNDFIEIIQERETNTTPLLSQDTMGFLNSPQFDKETYELLKYRIEVNPKFEKTQKALILELSNSLFDMGKKAIENGLLKEFMARANAYLDHFCSGRSNEAKGKKTCVMFLMAQACIASGNFSQAYEYLLDSNESYGFRDQWKITLPGVSHYWNMAYYFIFLLVGLENSRKDTYGSAIIDYNNNDSDVSQVVFHHPKRLNGEIILFEESDLTEQEFHIPWITNFEVDLGQAKGLNFAAKPITLAEYKNKFYNNKLNFESQRKVIQSYGVHSS